MVANRRPRDAAGSLTYLAMVRAMAVRGEAKRTGHDVDEPMARASDHGDGCLSGPRGHCSGRPCRRQPRILSARRPCLVRRQRTGAHLQGNTGDHGTFRQQRPRSGLAHRGARGRLHRDGRGARVRHGRRRRLDGEPVAAGGRRGHHAGGRRSGIRRSGVGIPGMRRPRRPSGGARRRDPGRGAGRWRRLLRGHLSARGASRRRPGPGLWREGRGLHVEHRRVRGARRCPCR
jgi:hypothetical protein